MLVGELRGKSREELRAMMRQELEMLKQPDEREREIEVWEREGKVPALTEGTQASGQEKGSPSNEKLP